MSAKIFFYTAEPTKFDHEISSTLSLAAHSSYQFQSVYSTKKLKQVLHNEDFTNPILVLIAMDHGELKELLEIKLLYSDVPIILIIADESEETLRRARMFRPKFLTTIEYDYVCVLSVIEHVAKTIEMNDPLHNNSCDKNKSLPN